MLQDDEDVACSQMVVTPHRHSTSDESCTPSGMMTGRNGEMLISPRPPMNTPTGSTASDATPERPTPAELARWDQLGRLGPSSSAPPTMVQHGHWRQRPQPFPADFRQSEEYKDYLKKIEVSCVKNFNFFFRQNTKTYIKQIKLIHTLNIFCTFFVLFRDLQLHPHQEKPIATHGWRKNCQNASCTPSCSAHQSTMSAPCFPEDAVGVQ